LEAETAYRAGGPGRDHRAEPCHLADRLHGCQP
jgi:hypothetical protein